MSEKNKPQVSSNITTINNSKQVTRDCFYMAIASLFGREPDDLIITNTDINDFEVTALYHPKDKFGPLPVFSNFVIHYKGDPKFEISLKDYKKRYMEFRNIVLDMVSKAKQKNNQILNEEN